MGLAAVPLLRSQSFDATVRAAEGSNSGDTGRDRRRIWREGRISVDDCGTRGAARVEVRQAGENHLRSGGGYGGDDEAPPVANEAAHGRNTRREITCDGHRFHDRWRRI